MQQSMWMVEDKSMSACCPRKTKTGGLTDISSIMRKPEPPGAVFPANLYFFSFHHISLN